MEQEPRQRQGAMDAQPTEEREAPRPRATTKELLQRTQETRARIAPRGTRRGEARRPRLPRAAWVCFWVALLNTVAWSLIVPLFETPDEPGHVAYVQHVAESGKPPPGGADLQHFSQEERRLLDAIRWKAIQRKADDRVPGTASFHKRVERDVATRAERLSEGGYTTDINNPPLYYFAAAGVYHLSPWTSLPDRIHAVRLFSALLAAITVLFAFLFLRELIPSTPWAWTVGALAVAFQPMFGFTASGVTSDAVLYSASAGVFYAFALAFRRGLTPRRGLAIGGLAVIGLLSKLNMIGLAPGIAVGLLVLVLRADGDQRRRAIRGALTAFAVVAIPVAGYMLLNSTVWDRGIWFGNAGVPPLTGIPVPNASGEAQTASVKLLDGIEYMWQFYLPRLPSMDPQFPEYPLRHIWFNGFIGQFGWLEYGFPHWVYNVALAIAVGIVALVARELIRVRDVLRSRIWELATYVLLMFGLLVLVSATSYQAKLGGAMGYEQPRYLLPLMALYGALIAIAARGAGKRWGPAAGVLLVSIAIAHSAAAMLLTLTRFYG
jgi:4-amino-4-deoxy-L-arabinose transferase-like glycosyltransferase